MKILIYLFTFLFFTGAAHGQVSMMGDVSQAYLDKLIAIGRANYPKYKQTQARENSMKAAYQKTKMGIFDFVSFSYVYFPGNSFSVLNNNGASSALSGYQAGLFVNVGTLLAKPATIKQAKEEYIGAQMDKLVTDLTVDQEIRRRYYTYIQAVSIMKIKSAAMTDADGVMKSMKYKFEKGEVTFDLYNQALLSFSNYSMEKINAESGLLIAKTNLEELLGTTLENIK
ncbi:MAG: TolC family protein [Bacteroidota bacterium]